MTTSYARPYGSGYFGTAPGEEVGVKALVSEEHDRAAPKGTGSVKVT